LFMGSMALPCLRPGGSARENSGARLSAPPPDGHSLSRVGTDNHDKGTGCCLTIRGFYPYVRSCNGPCSRVPVTRQIPRPTAKMIRLSAREPCGSASLLCPTGASLRGGVFRLLRNACGFARRALSSSLCTRCERWRSGPKQMPVSAAWIYRATAAVSAVPPIIVTATPSRFAEQNRVASSQTTTDGSSRLFA